MGETGCPLHGGHLMVEEMQTSVPVRPRSNITILWNKKDLREKKEFIDTQSEPTLDGRDEILGEGRNHGISAERIYPGGNSNTGPMPCHGEFLYHAKVAWTDVLGQYWWLAWVLWERLPVCTDHRQWLSTQEARWTGVSSCAPVFEGRVQQAWRGHQSS